ncbi:MAG: pilus assembly protein TadG-related protein [Dehalococcoidia bacterium]
MFVESGVRRLWRWWRCERGQGLILSAFAMAALLGIAALVVDVGYVYQTRRDAQKAADAAALAGAGFLLEGASPSQAIAAAQEWAEKNGYNDSDDTSVTVNIPPTSGPHSGDSRFVEVIIERDVDAFFARVLGVNTWNAHQRAVAGITSAPRAYSIITLNPTASNALELSGNVRITINGAGMFDNSAHASSAFYANGNVSVNTEVNHVVGGWRLIGNVHIEPPPSNAGHIEDPLADLPVPTPPTGPVRTCPNLSGNGSYTFQPGVYNCTINPNGNWNLTFQPGDYHITGGIVFNGNLNATFGEGLYVLGGQGLKVTGNADITGLGVTFYIDQGCLWLTGNAELDLEAPDSGTYAGILIFQNRSLTCQLDLNGNAAAGNWGTVYAAGAKVRFTGNASTSFQFIADTFQMVGNSNVTIDFDDSVTVGAPSMRLTE